MIVGVSPAIRRALALAERYARTQLPVIIVGATGTGKELFAQHIHERSGRRGPLVDVNCCALPRDMVESLLFGHRRGAFTGALESTIGYVERSDGGTLFLDELASLELLAQGKLLRVLETGYVEPLGAATKRRVDLRVMSTGQDNMARALATGEFRQDLFQRLAGVLIELVPLAARPEDVMPLAEYFAAADGRSLEPGVREELLNYAWPGNVRELRMVIERAGELVENGTLSRSAVAEAINLGHLNQGAPRTGSKLLGRYVLGREEVLAALSRNDWDARRTAADLGVGRTTLFKRLKEFGLSLRAERTFTGTP